MRFAVKCVLIVLLSFGPLCFAAAENAPVQTPAFVTVQNADSYLFFAYNGRVYVQNGVLPAPVAKLLQKEHIGKTKALPDKGLGEYVPESADALPQLCGNFGGLQVYTLRGVYHGSLLLGIDADGIAHIFKRK